MRKIFVFFTIVLSFLFLPILKVNGMTIPDASEVKFYNLEWVYRGQGSSSDEFIYDLMVEIEPDYYEPLNVIIEYEMEELNDNGVVAFNFPRSKSTSVEEIRIIYRFGYSYEPQVFLGVDINYIAVKKIDYNLGELYIDYDGSTYILNYHNGFSQFEIIKFQLYIPDYSLVDAYNEGYIDGYIDGKIAGDELKYELGYQEGYDNGYQDGEQSGFNDGYSIGYVMVGRRDGLMVMKLDM